MKKSLTLIGLLAIVLLASSAMAAGSFADLPLDPMFFPNPLSVSFDGSVVGGFWQGPVIYSESDGLFFPDPSLYGDYSAALGNCKISGDGLTLTLQVADGSGNEYPAYWNQAEGLVVLPPAPESTFCGPSAMSNYATNFDATVHVGLGYYDGCEPTGYKYVAGDAASLYLGNNGSGARASDVSGDGSVIGGWAYYPGEFQRVACLWFPGDSEPTMLYDGTQYTEVMAVSHDGARAAGQAPGGALYWDGVVGAVNIGTLPGDEGFGAYANDISLDGKVVGQSGSIFFGTPRAFIWTFEDGMMYLGDYLVAQGVPGVEGLNFSTATGISDDGNTIVGSYTNFMGMHQPFIVHLSDVVANEDPGNSDTPTATRLVGAYPNPFNPMTTVKFSLQQGQNVRLSVYDMSGRLVSELADRPFTAGEHSVVWQGRDGFGRSVASGSYLLHMVTDTSVQTSTMTLMR